MKHYKTIDPIMLDDGKVVGETISIYYGEEGILYEYWHFWKEQMEKKFGVGHELITEDICVADWCAVMFAEVTEC